MQKISKIRHPFLTIKRPGPSHSRKDISTQGLDKSIAEGTPEDSFSASSGDLLDSDELSDVTLSPSTEPASSRDSETASSFLVQNSHHHDL